MADEITPHGAALTLLRIIAFGEGKNLQLSGGNANAPSREWVLWTYAQCLQTVLDPTSVKGISTWPVPKEASPQK
jgi:hypothetical protein